MRRLAFWTLLVVLPAAGVYGAPTKEKAAPAAASEPQASVVQSSMKDLERNAALGAALTHREGSPDELATVQKLADRGLETARALAEKDPKSAEARYLLGSWLLYGYRVVERERLVVDAGGEEHRRKVKVVVQGLSDTPQDGLDALRAAHVLAPANLKYLLDYGSALLDCDQSAEAMGVVRAVWSESMKLAPGEEAQVALLMSDIHLARGDVREARSWIYRALSAQPQNAPIVTRLKKLDALQEEAARASEEESGASSEAPPAASAPGEGEGAAEPAPAASATGASGPAPPAAGEPAAEVGD